MRGVRNLFLILSVLIGCTDKDNNNSNQISVINTITSGNWKITSFIDSGDDETNHFTGYVFTFVDPGALNATNGTNNYMGAWKINDSNTDDDTLDDLSFIIDFPIPPDFEELSEDWDIIELTETRLKLQHISGGGGGTDVLIFEKNK